MATITFTFTDASAGRVDLDVHGDLFVEDIDDFSSGKEPTPAQLAAMAAMMGASDAARTTSVEVIEEVAR